MTRTNADSQRRPGLIHHLLNRYWPCREADTSVLWHAGADSLYAPSPGKPNPEITRVSFHDRLATQCRNSSAEFVRFQLLYVTKDAIRPERALRALQPQAEFYRILHYTDAYSEDPIY